MATDDGGERGQVRFREGWLDAGYTQVPNAVLRHPDLSPGAKVVYALLLSYAWQDDHCWPGQRRLAEDAASSERSVRTWLLELRTAGLVTVEQRGLTLSNIYWIEALGSVAGLTGKICRSGPAANAEQDRQDQPTKKTPANKTQPRRDTSPDLDALWSAVLSDLREQTVPANYARWLARTELAALADGAATVRVPDRVTAEQLARRFDQLVCRALADAAGHAVAVRYEAPE